MTLFKKLIAIAAMTMASSTSLAAVHIEPYLNYAVSGEQEWTTGSNVDYSGGPIIGGRLGYGMLGFFAALDYEMGTLTADYSPEIDSDTKNLGIAVGYEFPILLRAYATYFFDATDDLGSNEFKGTGTRLGVGFTGLPFVAINLEMTSMSYDEVNGNSFTPERKTTYYSLGVSLPLSF